MKKLFLLFSLLLLFPVLRILGQGAIVYPVQVNVSLVAPYSLYLSDYVSGSRDRLLVTLINRDVRYQSMPVRLRLTIKGNGFSVQTRPYASVSPLTLEPNLPYRLTVDDLQPYFDPRNLSAQGLGGDSFLKGKRLPEGMVEFGVEVLEYNTGKLLSRKGIGTAWLTLQKPPLLNLPFNGETVSWREPLNLLFQWSPQSLGSARVEYELIVKELWDNGMAPESAFAYSPEIFRERIPSTSYLYGVQSPPLEAGHRYAWAVRVVPKDGADDENIVENDGLSEIRSFRVGRYCPPPANIKATAERGYIRVDWEGMPEHLRYAVSYRLQGREEWHDEYSTFPSAMLPGIRGGYTYEYRVAGFCDADIPTYNDHIGSITVPSEDTARLRNCGVLRPVDLSNQEPLDKLSDGDQFMAGDFPVHVQKISGGNGYFTGHGYVHVPFLGNAPFKVAFDNIFINTDRRMIRGVVKTVYDASEGGVTDLDDIFVGGNTGEVKEGITKTDLSAAFAIDPGADFYFDEVTGRIEMTDEDGQVIGYIETGSAMTGGESIGGNDGNVSSVFPMTVRDTTGSLYRIDTLSEELPASSSDVKKKLVVTPVGKSVDALDGDKVNLKRIDDDIARIVFKDCEGSRYAFDEWQPAYSQSYLIRAKYEQIGKDYHVPAKLLPSGKPDKVSAVLEIKDSSVNPDHVVFRTATGTEYRPESYDAKTKTWILPLVGGETDDGQELYALYPKSDGGYYNLGKLLVVTYPEYRFKVKIVPVSAELKEFDALRRTLQDIYARAGIECEVEKLPVFNYDVPSLFQKGSGLFSAYTPEMKALNAAYASAHVVEEDAAYLFVLSRSGHKKDLNFSGFMPLNKQYGYLFRDDFKDFEEFATAAAHELAHGRLSLRHPFDKSLGLSEGDLPDNLMDYRNGRELAKWQWDVIHDPGVVVRIFERDKDAMLSIEDGISRLVVLMREAGASGCAFIQRCEMPVTSLRDGEIRLAYQGRYYRCVIGNYTNDTIVPKKSDSGESVWNIDNSSLRQFFDGMGDSQNIVLYEKAGTTNTCVASEDYSDFSTLSDPWESASFLSRWSADLSRCMSSDNAFASDRTYQLESLSLSEIDILDKELVKLVGNPLFSHLRFHVSLTTVSGKHSDYKSFSDGDADITLKYLIDDVTRQVHVKLEYNESLFSSSLSSSLALRAAELGISESDLRKESVEAMRILKEEMLPADDFWSSLRQLILGTTKQVQVCGNIGKSIWDTGEIPKGLWLVNDNSYHYYEDNSFTLGQIPAGISDGVIGELCGLPLMIKTVGEIVIDKEKREAFGQLFSWDGLEAMWEGLKEEYAGSWNDLNRRQYIVSKTTIDIATLFTGGGLVSKGADVAKASNDGKALIQKGIERFSKEVPGPKALKGLTGEVLNQRKVLLANLNKKLSTEQIEKALHFVPLEDVEDFLNLLDRLKDNSTLNSVLPQLGEFYNKDKGARFVLKYAGSFPPEIINTIRFEDMVKIFDQFGNETKRVYDFVIDGKKYELKAWTKWAHWSDDAFLNQFAKDIASIDKLGNLQWVFMKTENITEENLHKYIIGALKSQKGRNELIRCLKLEKTKALFGFSKKIDDSNELVENIIKYFENKEKFYTLFKLVE